jgi:Domain of unknown function (DUF4386)
MNAIKSTKPLGILLIIQSLLIFVPMFILGTSINWPESLNSPANEILPLIYSKATEVGLGYFIYFIYSILFFFTGTILVSELKKTSTNQSCSELKLAQSAAGLSSLARVIGIIRWLIPFPILAATYVTTSNQNLRLIQETVYTVFNTYGGAIGELLGVTIFASIWGILVSMEFIKQKQLPSILGYFGIVAAFSSLALLLEIFGIAIPVSISQTLFHLWMLATGVYFFVRKNK